MTFICPYLVHALQQQQQSLFMPRNYNSIDLNIITYK